LPPDNPLAVALLPPEGVHKYVKGAVPPVAETVADPFAWPLQPTLLLDEMDAVGPPTLETAADADEVQPFWSVTVTVYDPANRLLAVAPKPPCGDHA
jgi:hypothetical protein